MAPAALSLAYRGWRDLHVAERIARVEGDYRLRLRRNVEEHTADERREHAAKLASAQGEAARLSAALASEGAAARAGSTRRGGTRRRRSRR